MRALTKIPILFLGSLIIIGCTTISSKNLDAKDVIFVGNGIVRTLYWDLPGFNGTGPEGPPPGPVVLNRIDLAHELSWAASPFNTTTMYKIGNLQVTVELDASNTPWMYLEGDILVGRAGKPTLGFILSWSRDDSPPVDVHFGPFTSQCGRVRVKSRDPLTGDPSRFAKKLIFVHKKYSSNTSGATDCPGIKPTESPDPIPPNVLK